MQDTNVADEPFFRALLTPHRSLGRTGFRVVMSVLTFGSLATGVLFLVDGAWPILFFCGANVIGVYVAFRLNYRAARVHEEVALSRTRLDIRKVAASGRAEEHRFNPFWAHFAISRHQEIGITRMVVETRSESVPIGAFLNPDDRESFANAFSRALATAKGR
jgi:uncharacterized membrane protein